MTDLHKENNVILAIVCIAVLIIQIDTSVVNLSLKHIGTSLNASISQLQWVVDAYNLLFASLMLTGATLGDLYGRRRIFVLGSLIFIVGSLICGVASNIDVLIAGRVITGLGAALMLPVSLSIIAVTFTDAASRGRAIGIWASCNGIAFIVGPTLGGLLVDLGGWRTIFFIAIPFGILAITGAMAKIPNSFDNKRRLDLLGQFFAVVFLASLTIVSIEGNNWGWQSNNALISYTIIITSLLLFTLVERSQSAPLIPLSFFRNITLSASLLVAGLMTFAMYALLFIIPIYLLGIVKINSILAGLALLPMSISFVIVSQKSGKLIEKYNYNKVMSTGMLLMTIGTALMAYFLTSSSLWLVEISLLIIGIGLGLNTAPVVAIALMCAAPNRSGTISGLTNTARMIGATLGVAIIGSVLSRYSNAIVLDENSLVGFKVAFGVATIFLLLGTLIVYLFIKNKPNQLVEDV